MRLNFHLQTKLYQQIKANLTRTSTYLLVHTSCQNLKNKSPHASWYNMHFTNPSHTYSLQRNN